MAFEALAVLTNEAKRRMAEVWNPNIGTCYRVKTFAVSAGGHDPNDPTTALTPDPSATTMPGAPPIFGPEPIDAYELVADDCPVYVCSIAQGEVTGGISTVALFAEIVDSVANPGEIGTSFLFAVYNRPLLILTGTDDITFRLQVFF